VTTTSFHPQRKSATDHLRHFQAMIRMMHPRAPQPMLFDLEFAFMSGASMVVTAFLEALRTEGIDSLMDGYIGKYANDFGALINEYQRMAAEMLIKKHGDRT